MNLQTLAKYSGCSVSTVSKAFSGSSEISEDTKNKIFEIAKELGCFEKYSKEIYGKKLIAVLCPETESAYYTSFLSYLNTYISAHGGTMAISLTGFSKEKEAELISFYSSQNHSDGIIVLEGHTQAKKHMTIPTVYLNSEFENHYTDVVNLDYYSGIYDAILNFKLSGHTKIGFIGESLSRRKLEHFRSAMINCGLTIDENLIITSDKRFEQAGTDAMEKLFSQGSLPTAIFAAYDYIALGAIEIIEKHGLSVPKDISIIGSDNIKLAHYNKTPLSSIDPCADEACKIIVDKLFYRIENPRYCSAQSITVRSRFISRKSVK
ncbi:MAG: LacI family DNA-binding transcriptional regulator [Clostridia bacterium]|nr:LacI family DNA-binding transcriptional regulator [Clostridia bacterium]